ncbi:MAG: hypothetical protein J7604_21825 [Sporocytophaga sp.]|uniref:hypothetical protein n=1 Tax=Sporocytophaga sp. TaxID=2231183 RepID=UPI001B1A22C4|nr:hypothetical protein [Sporocytophaga sp.]MBO9702868.1 hypothetical protein [Sporocytophaga sp.]
MKKHFRRRKSNPEIMNNVLLLLTIIIVCLSCSKVVEDRNSGQDFFMGKWKIENIKFTGWSSGFDVPFSERGAILERFLENNFVIEFNPDSTFYLTNKNGFDRSDKYKIKGDSLFLMNKNEIFNYFIVDSLNNNRLYLSMDYAYFYSVADDTFYTRRGKGVNVLMKRD